MASSRRSARAADPVVAAVSQALREACVAAAPSPQAAAVVVAWSGGLDSTVLLHAAVAGAPAGMGVVAVHVDHGLQPAAEDWAAHCLQEAARFGVPCEVHRVADAPPSGASVEAWARERRYAALIEAARRHRALAVLTAHHADDQVETMLIRIARGCGVDGLAGIAARGRRQGVPLLRPLLGLARTELAAHAQRHGLRWVEDPSNRDPAHLRNAFRHAVLPVLDEVSPAFRRKLLRLAGRLEEARAAIAALAHLDLEAATVDATAIPAVLDADALARLPAARRAAALRLWLARLSLRAPAEAKLAEIERQLVHASGAYGEVPHDGLLLRRHRRRILVTGPAQPVAVGGHPAPDGLALTWRGERSMAVPGFAGELQFDEHDALRADEEGGEGVSAQWLLGRTLTVCRPVSTLRLRVHPAGRARTLKNLYQERGIPAWRRPSLPLVIEGERVLFAAGLGMDRTADWPRGGRRVSLRWAGPHV